LQPTDCPVRGAHPNIRNGRIPERARRRTFAIISHPDAGKTTLTEKLLLYAGAIHIAGSVKARKASRYATSDWMEIEKAAWDLGRELSDADGVPRLCHQPAGHTGSPGFFRRTRTAY